MKMKEIIKRQIIAAEKKKIFTIYKEVFSKFENDLKASDFIVT